MTPSPLPEIYLTLFYQSPYLKEYHNDYKSTSFGHFMNLVACVGTDRENWGQITALINRMESEQVVLICNGAADDFPTNERCVVIHIDSTQPLLELKQTLIDKLKPVLGKDFEVALSLASGSGKEHMALVAALLNIPVGIRLVVYTKQGIETIT